MQNEQQKGQKRNTSWPFESHLKNSFMLYQQRQCQELDCCCDALCNSDHHSATEARFSVPVYHIYSLCW